MTQSKRQPTHRRTTATSSGSELRSLTNVGAAVEGYLIDLGIRSVADLVPADPYELFRRLQRRNRKACDPCLYDTFAAIVHEARTGEKTPWFAWTAERKRRQAAGELDLRFRR
jgi:hypothetical protein